MTEATLEHKKNMLTFLIVWFGQTISVLGNGLTLFALSWWVWTTYKSGVALAGVELVSTLSPILLGPFAGAYIDRWDRRKVMLVMDICNGCVSLVMAALFLTNHLSLPAVYILGVLSSLALTFHAPAFDAIIPDIVPDKHLGRANGMQQFNLGIMLVFSPIVGGSLLALGLTLGNIVVLDTLSFWIAALTLLLVRMPHLAARAREIAQQQKKQNVWQDVRFGLIYIWNRQGLFWILVLISIQTLAWNPYSILIPQLVTDKFAGGPTLLGSIDSAMGIAYLGGSILMSVWGGPKRRIYGAVGVLAVKTLFLALAGFAPTPLLTTIPLCICAITIAVQNASSNALWQSKVAPEVRGRVMATRRSIAYLMKPISLLIAGFLTPAIMRADSYMIIAGTVGTLITLVALVAPALRNVDDLPCTSELKPVLTSAQAD